LVTVETFRKYAGSLRSEATSATGTISLIQSIKDRLGPLGRGIDNASFFPALVLQRATASGTALELLLYLYDPVRRNLTMAFAAMTLVSGTRPFGLAVFLFTVLFYRFLGGRCRRAKKTIFLPALPSAQSHLETPVLILQIIDLTLLLQAQRTGVDAH
jgi:hypothetical protein